MTTVGVSIKSDSTPVHSDSQITSDARQIRVPFGTDSISLPASEDQGKRKHGDSAVLLLLVHDRIAAMLRQQFAVSEMAVNTPPVVTPNRVNLTLGAALLVPTPLSFKTGSLV